MRVNFVRDVLCGNVSSFPEIIEAIAEDAATQSEDGTSAVDGPVHSGALETGADGMLATGLDTAPETARPSRSRGR